MIFSTLLHTSSP